MGEHLLLAAGKRIGTIRSAGFEGGKVLEDTLQVAVHATRLRVGSHPEVLFNRKVTEYLASLGYVNDAHPHNLVGALSGDRGTV